MRVLETLPQNPENADCALTIGTFDGVHRGHALLLETLKSEARKRGLQAAALTFQDMPYCHFRPDDCPRLLTLPDEKRAAFSAFNLDTLYLIPFDAALAAQSAQEFATRVLAETLRAKLLVLGPDFALGKNRGGDISTLRELGKTLGFEVVVLGEKLRDDGDISSTRVRECVESGHLRTAARLLGRTFQLSGDVVSGQQLGRTIGVPTINITPHARKVLPQNGVYAARAFFDSDAKSADAKSDGAKNVALNIGWRPTVGGKNLSVEFHVIGENIEISPRRVTLEIIERLRGEEKFPNLDALVAQMQRDIARASEILRAS
jgi:riboflavin kinase/FMN adenylyltransferase